MALLSFALALLLALWFYYCGLLPLRCCTSGELLLM